MHPLERLLNLVALLLEARRPLTFEQIRDKLPAYAQDDLSTAKRMFERDKDILRDVGVPVELRATDAWEVEEGYFIDKKKYYLPEIDFTPEEISALYVAALAPGEGSPAGEGVRKLLFGVDASRLADVSGRPASVTTDAAGERLVAVADAIRSRRQIRFAYRTAQGQKSKRRVDPYGLVTRAGRWYLVGLDHDRGDIRAFRLSRFVSKVAQIGTGSEPPEAFHAAEHVQGGPWEGEFAEGRARITFSPDVAWWATRGVPGAKTGRARRDGWVEVSVPDPGADALAEWVLSFGPDAKVLTPVSLRDAVVARLEATRDAL